MSMKIIKLTVENFMRLVAVEITPKGNTILITGKNAAGKSSVLEAIKALFQGKKYHPEKPIRDGADRAEIIGETENFIIKRTFTKAGGDSVTVMNAEGMKASSVQGLLDKFYGEFAFEPMEFYKDCRNVKKQREQLYTLMKLVGLDFDDINVEIAKVRNNRSIVKTEKDTYDFEAGQIPEQPDVGHELILMSELTEKLTLATQLNEKHAEVERQIEAEQKGIEGLMGRLQNNKTNLATSNEQLELIEKNYQERCSVLKLEYESHLEQEKKNWVQSVVSLNKQLEMIKTGQALAEKELVEARAKQEELVATLEPLIDVAAINQCIENADAHNLQIRLNQQRTELRKKSAAKSEEFAKLGKDMKALEVKKADKLAAVKMPIDKLSVNEKTILYDNIPLAQVNDSMQLQISVAISMALKPELKVILIKGNDLDEASLAAVCKMAEEKGYQVWIEKVSDDKKNRTGFIIEDGSVVAADDIEDSTMEAAKADKDVLFTDKE